MNLQPFFDAVLPLYKGSLPERQKRPLEMLIRAGLDRGRSLTEIAYVLATGHLETQRFLMFEELGRGAGEPYGETVWLARGNGVTYHGRGIVQLTWLGNYLAMSKIVGVDLVSNPEAAKDLDVAVAIAWEGMIRGTFTGKALADYFGEPGEPDFLGARRIINGLDRASEIADFARRFLDALEKADLGDDMRAPCARDDCPLRAA